jgi:hypothetical protein
VAQVTLPLRRPKVESEAMTARAAAAVVDDMAEKKSASQNDLPLKNGEELTSFVLLEPSLRSPLKTPPLSANKKRDLSTRFYNWYRCIIPLPDEPQTS